MDSEYFESLYPDTTRFSEIEKIMHYINEGVSCQILGIPGVSRSTLLELLIYNKRIRLKHLGAKQEATHFVLVNFSEIRNRPLIDAMKFIFLSLGESLRERKMGEEHQYVTELFRDHLRFNDELVLFQGLKQAIDFLAIEKKLTIVLLFDRFEDYVPTVTSEFFANLRTLRNRAKFRFSIVFSLNRPLEEVFEPTVIADFYEFSAEHLVFLRLYDEMTTSFRVAYMEKVTGKKLAPALLSDILLLTGGHGKLTKLAVETALAHEMPQANDLAGFLLQQKAIQGALREIWTFLSPAEQADMLEGKFPESHIAEYLERVGLLKEQKIQIPLLEQFIRLTFSVKKVEEEKIMFDSHTNSIRKGSIALSDALTSSEFRLLRYLLQNQDRVVEREELIGAVWADMKSTAGITDQAIDQLVFRLRRKIEEDANNPIHLQTVKGRGFRFVA